MPLQRVESSVPLIPAMPPKASPSFLRAVSRVTGHKLSDSAATASFSTVVPPGVESSSIDYSNAIGDVTVIPPGGFAKDWSQITALSGDRILFYSATTGRGSVCSVTPNNVIKEVTPILAGGFAKD
ncbi:hypothetical protein [Streptomyces sp. NPDC056527]|uniref:hypothetical protein n=1 Tax=Streptomyces sp. NPDC056527 TaxID=3345853 RepID=UPI00369896AF